MTAFDTLDFVDAHRVGGPQSHDRRYFDYAINGSALRTKVDAHDNIGLFGWLPRDVEAQFARWLLLRERSGLPSGRVPLYICPECGDLGCQTLSARVIAERDRFMWTEFAYEANYDDGPATAFVTAPVFSFEKRAYEAAIQRFLA